MWSRTGKGSEAGQRSRPYALMVVKGAAPKVLKEDLGHRLVQVGVVALKVAEEARLLDIAGLALGARAAHGGLLGREVLRTQQLTSKPCGGA